jgi:hypothetical protein
MAGVFYRSVRVVFRPLFDLPDQYDSQECALKTALILSAGLSPEIENGQVQLQLLHIATMP